ncbi:hypothetical protein HG531_000052 [Fusarium graminearum]|nr:hypothetical protein HG531_000052 [Fusarium graminearum]
MLLGNLLNIVLVLPGLFRTVIAKPLDQDLLLTAEGSMFADGKDKIHAWVVGVLGSSAGLVAPEVKEGFGAILVENLFVAPCALAVTPLNTKFDLVVNPAIVHDALELVLLVVFLLGLFGLFLFGFFLLEGLLV